MASGCRLPLFRFIPGPALLSDRVNVSPHLDMQDFMPSPAISACTLFCRLSSLSAFVCSVAHEYLLSHRISLSYRKLHANCSHPTMAVIRAPPLATVLIGMTNILVYRFDSRNNSFGGGRTPIGYRNIFPLSTASSSVFTAE